MAEVAVAGAPNGNEVSEASKSQLVGSPRSKERQANGTSSHGSSSSREVNENGKSTRENSDRAREEAAKRKKLTPPGPNAKAEERARYELERKKVAKYKEDKLKARRDHARMILESHAQAKRRALLGKQSEFLTTLEFRNTLPDLPFDTKFLHYPYERERLVKYKPNSLESEYVYEIHEEPNLGLNIDLIDPAKYEAPANPGPLEIGDEAALMMKENRDKTAKSKIRPNATWLRRTEYLGTDLYDAVHKFKNEIEIQSELRERTESALQEVVQYSLKDRAEDSFRDIKNPKILVHPFNKKLQIAKSWDVFPDQILYPNTYTILSYDVLPSADSKNKNKTMVDRENRALLCGITKKSETTEFIQGSVLLPQAREEEEQKEQDEASGPEKFSYYREYLLDFKSLDKSGPDAQHCVFMFDPESNQFTYGDVHYRITLKKTKKTADEKRRRGAIVHRRSYSQGETLKREEIQRAVGGIHESSASKNSSTTKKPVNSTAVAVSSPRKAPLSSQNEKKTAEEIAAKAKAAKEEQKRKEKELGFGSDSDSSDNNNNNSPDISGSSDGSDSE